MDELDMLFGVLIIIILIISGIFTIIGASKEKRACRNKKTIITDKERAGIGVEFSN